MNAEITFFEKSVTYDKFVTDIAARLASFMKEEKTIRNISHSGERKEYTDRQTYSAGEDQELSNQ